MSLGSLTKLAYPIRNRVCLSLGIEVFGNSFTILF